MCRLVNNTSLEITRDYTNIFRHGFLSPWHLYRIATIAFSWQSITRLCWLIFFFYYCEFWKCRACNFGCTAWPVNTND
jgi:hypothetical protein